MSRDGAIRENTINIQGTMIEMVDCGGVLNVLAPVEDCDYICNDLVCPHSLEIEFDF